MGWTPAAVDACSLWQFEASAAGWAKAQGGEVDADLTDDEFAAAEGLLDRFPERTV